MSSGDVGVGGAADVLSAASFAVLDEHLVHLVLDLVTTFAQSQVHVRQRLVRLHRLVQRLPALLHHTRPQANSALQPYRVTKSSTGIAAGVRARISPHICRVAVRSHMAHELRNGDRGCKLLYSV